MLSLSFFHGSSAKSEVVRNCMISSVRAAAQLGDPPERFYTNASESTNNVLRLKVDRKPQSLPAFVDHVQELACTYESNIERAFFHRGDWCLSENLTHASWSQKQQTSMLKKVLEATCSLSALMTQPSLHCGCRPSTSRASAHSSSSDSGDRQELSESYMYS